MSETPFSEAVLYFRQPAWSNLTRRWPLASKIILLIPLFVIVSELVIILAMIIRPDSGAERLRSPSTFALAILAVIAMLMLKGRWFPYHLTDGVVIGKTGPRWHYRALTWYWRPFANMLREKSRFGVWEQYESFDLSHIPTDTEDTDGGRALILRRAPQSKSPTETPFRSLHPDATTLRLPYDPKTTDADALATALHNRLGERAIDDGAGAPT